MAIVACAQNVVLVPSVNAAARPEPTATSGEAPSLSYRLRREVISQACRLVRGRVPVLVGITDTSFVESLELAIPSPSESRLQLSTSGRLKA